MREYPPHADARAHAPDACLRACSRDRGVKVWLGLLTQRYSIRYMRPVGLLQTALPGLLYVSDIPACAL
jgi:hypothetical protein